MEQATAISGDRVPPSERRVSALDGLRGIPILLVLFAHAGALRDLNDKMFHALLGRLGVDLFFALSGFLITGILLDHKKSPGYFRCFYGRRALRIFPLYFLFMAFALGVVPAIWPSQGTIRPYAGWCFVHLLNWVVAWKGHYLPEVWLNINICWSLSIEEQFYLVWPVAVYLCSPRQLKWICVAVVLTAAAVRGWMFAHGSPTMVIYIFTFARMDVLAVGALVAIGERSKDERISARALAGVAVIGFISLMTIACLPAFIWKFKVLDVVAGYSLAAVTGGALVLMAYRGQSRMLAWVCDRQVLQTYGKYSYAIYLLHWPAMMAFMLLAHRWKAIAFIPVAMAIGLVPGAISWHLWEKQWLKLKGWFAYPPAKTESYLPAAMEPLPAKTRTRWWPSVSRSPSARVARPADPWQETSR